jgi:hypothetical protein
MTPKGLVRPGLLAPKSLGADGRALRITGRYAFPAVADLPRGAGRRVFAARFDTPVPCLPGVLWVREHMAPLALGTRRLQAVGAIHLRALRGALVVLDALLTYRASSLLASGQTCRLGSRVGTEEACRTFRLNARVTWACAPTIDPRAQ